MPSRAKTLRDALMTALAAATGPKVGENWALPMLVDAEWAPIVEREVLTSTPLRVRVFAGTDQTEAASRGQRLSRLTMYLHVLGATPKPSEREEFLDAAVRVCEQLEEYLAGLAPLAGYSFQEFDEQGVRGVVDAERLLENAEFSSVVAPVFVGYVQGVNRPCPGLTSSTSSIAPGSLTPSTSTSGRCS